MSEVPPEVSERYKCSNLRQKMLAVMTDIEHIEKRGEHPKFHYAFAQAADVSLEVRKAFLKYGIVFVSSEGEPAKMLESAESTAGNEVFRCVVWMKFTFYDVDSDEKIEGFSSGEAMDNQDKGVNKAKTAALKTFLLQTFLIPTGDDIEAEDHEAKGKGASKARKGTGPTACPSCGIVGAIIKGKEEYGGGWLCFGKKGGCGAKFATDPSIPPAVSDRMPADNVDMPTPSVDMNAPITDKHRQIFEASMWAKMSKDQARVWLKGQLVKMGAKYKTLTLGQFNLLVENLGLYEIPKMEGEQGVSGETFSDEDVRW